MATPRIKNTAVLIGYNADGASNYSEIVSLSDYYDGDHVWDEPAKIKRLKLHRVRGYLFDHRGQLEQEFESIFDPQTGHYLRGETRFADGTVQRT